MIRIAFGSWLVLAGLGLTPEIWSVSWWVLIAGGVCLSSGLEAVLDRGRKEGEK